jgi:hypothetical protein
VTGTTDVVLAAMLTARAASPEIRALAACHFLLTDRAQKLGGPTKLDRNEQ